MLLPWLQGKKQKQSKRTPNGRGRFVPRRSESFQPRLELLEDRTLLNGGVLDPTFGSGGIVTTALHYQAGDQNNIGFNSVAQQADGKILVAGATSGAAGFTVARFNPNGSLD